MRVKDVCERTGLSRQAIHFYVEQGLVPPPTKTGQTMGHYTEAHVERILLVKQLQHDHFLPLRAIRAMLEGGEDLTAAQRRAIADVRARLPDDTVAHEAGQVSLAPLLRKASLSRRDAIELGRAGLLDIRRGAIPAHQVWIVELWGEVRAAGLTRELGVTAELLAVCGRGIAQILAEERAVLTRMLTTLPAARVAELVERALPLVHAFLVRSHQAKVRELFGS